MARGLLRKIERLAGGDGLAGCNQRPYEGRVGRHVPWAQTLCSKCMVTSTRRYSCRRREPSDYQMPPTCGRWKSGASEKCALGRPGAWSVLDTVCGTRKDPRPWGRPRETIVPQVCSATLLLWRVEQPKHPSHCPEGGCMHSRVQPSVCSRAERASAREWRRAQDYGADVRVRPSE